MTGRPVAVPLMDPVRGYRAYRDEIDAAVRGVLEGGTYILGPAVEAFEAAFSRWSGIGGTVAVANGTDAIEVSLRALGVGAGDLVFTVSHTAVATVAAVELAGATPVLIDVDPRTFTMDPQKLEESIARFSAAGSRHGRPRAVVAVHLYGHPCDLDALGYLCRRHGLFLIEDCSQAHGARLAGRRVGTWGDAATFSFYPTKNLPAFGDGGAVCSSSPEILARCRELREYGWRERYVSHTAGKNSRLDELQAAILNVRLRHLDGEIERRRALAATYGTRMAHAVEVPWTADDCEHAFHLYVIRTPHRAALMASLRAAGIGVGIHYPQPVHLQPAYAGRVPLGSGGMGVTERIAAEVTSIPLHPFLSDEEVERVTAAVLEWSESIGRR